MRMNDMVRVVSGQYLDRPRTTALNYRMADLAENISVNYDALEVAD